MIYCLTRASIPDNNCSTRSYLNAELKDYWEN
jgi:hypothetical protein